jgi:hypothetical protein
LGPRKALAARRSRRALDSARVLEDVVQGQLSLVARLPQDSRQRAAEHLSELVMLAQTYRHYARGWIGRAELDRRARESADRLVLLRRPSAEHVHLTEPE